ncbi:MAG: hypothetical protein N3C12_15275 [Candidatus Binatia bacterium]|nr:hypothetical protein [Candidatus Binatia bacterium]
MPLLSRPRAIVFLLVFAYSFPPVWAKEHGITGFSGMQGETCADSCHGDEHSPALMIEGPTQVTIGAVTSWRLQARPAGPAMVGAGVNVAVAAGELVPGDGLYAEAGELTHLSPQRSADTNRDARVSAGDVIVLAASILSSRGFGACVAGDANGDGKEDRADLDAVVSRLFVGALPWTWEFQWRAPSEPQTVQFYAAVVSANCNGTRGGDGVGKLRWAVDVVAEGTSR